VIDPSSFLFSWAKGTWKATDVSPTAAEATTLCLFSRRRVATVIWRRRRRDDEKPAAGAEI